MSLQNFKRRKPKNIKLEALIHPKFPGNQKFQLRK
jgi:hypothetical protein